MVRKQLNHFSVNDQEVDVASSPHATLLETLREDLRILSPKRGCNQGVCGACTVLVDGIPVRACLTLTALCEGREVHTVEGLNGDPIVKALQKHMVEKGGVQCGFCTGGILASARDLLANDPTPSRETVKSALSGNVCRCTGYHAIIDAVCGAAEELAQ